MQYATFGYHDATSYWQLELLLESFYQKNIQDKLTVFLFNDGACMTPDFKINRPNFQNIISIPSAGFNFKERKIDFLYFIQQLYKNNIIKEPCCIFDLNSIIINEPNINTDFIYKFDTSFNIKEYEHLYDMHFSKVQNFPQIGNIFIINKPLEQELLEYSIDLFLNTKDVCTEKNIPIPKNLQKLCLGQILLMSQNYKAEIKQDLSSGLTEKPKYFINYSEGAPPVFTMNMFTYENGYHKSLIYNQPYDAILDLIPTESIHQLQTTIKLMRGKNDTKNNYGPQN